MEHDGTRLKKELQAILKSPLRKKNLIDSYTFSPPWACLWLLFLISCGVGWRQGWRLCVQHEELWPRISFDWSHPISFFTYSALSLPSQPHMRSHNPPPAPSRSFTWRCFRAQCTSRSWSSYTECTRQCLSVIYAHSCLDFLEHCEWLKKQELNVTTPWWSETNLASKQHPVSASNTFVAKLFLCGSRAELLQNVVTSTVCNSIMGCVLSGGV